MGPGSAKENQAMKLDPIAKRAIMRSNQAVARMTGKLKASDDAYNALVGRVAEASKAEDPREALTHLLAEVHAEQAAKERR
jgi:hypothetical protein